MPNEVVSPDRIVPLTGGQNFREVGGYPTVDGGRLRRGLLWRSAKLDELTPEDVIVIQSLGIAAIADLRRSSERTLNPTSGHLLEKMRLLSWDSRRERDEGGSKSLFLEGAGPDHYFSAVLDLYRTIAEDHIDQLRDLYAAIAEGEVPMLVHCAAGKDRTGVAIGVLLDVLGIKRNFILADYAKTEELLDWTRLAATAALGTGAERSWLERLDPAALALIKRSDVRYLEAAFADIEAQFGSTLDFARDRLGLSETTIDQLRDRLVEH